MENYKQSTEIFFREFFDNKKSKKISKKLKSYNIHTLEQLHGALNPDLPEFTAKNISAKGLSLKYKELSKTKYTKDKKSKRLKNTLNITKSESDIIINALDKIKFPVSAHKDNKSIYSLGVKPSKYNIRSTFWAQAKFKQKGSSFIIPNYEKMGAVFNQGERGTCVANAFTSLIDYISSEKTSRQFLYHQCKMTDGIKNEEGTYMHVPFKLMSSKNIVDFGTVKDFQWKYNPNNTYSVHQGPPPENCFNTNRFYSSNIIINTRIGSIISDIKKILSGSNLHCPAPVAIGLRLYESFNNYQSRRTGWITMPLPGEKIIGAHAMLIVGYFDDEKLFLVRNSWGVSWANDNIYSYPGHALIPYDYVKNYSFQGGFTFININKSENKIIPPNERLYNKNIIFQSGNLSNKKLSQKKQMKKTNKNKIKNIKLKYFILGIISTLIVIYYSEIIVFVKAFIDWIKDF